MKQTPDEKKILENFRPGKMSKDGFLGTDDRHIHDIIREDMRALEILGLNRETVAERMTYFVDEGKKGLEGKVDLGRFIVQVRWDRGMTPCPFGEPGLHPKIVVTVFNKHKESTIKYSQLGVHLIRKHGFFGGRGSVFRAEPDRLADVLEIPKEG